MAYRIAWSPSAVDALVRATQYIAEDSPRHASAFRSEAVTVSRSLRNFPLRGRLVPETKGLGLRELFIGDYRLIYKVDGNDVIIIRFLHGARDLSADSTIYSQT